MRTNLAGKPSRERRRRGEDMEVLVGPTFSVDVSSPAATGEKLPASLFLKAEGEEAEDRKLVSGRIGSGVGFGRTEDSSESSSSIGAPDDSDDEEGEEVDSSVSSNLGLGSLDSLEESLPIKRGLSNHFSGKSKSFANLSDMSSVASVKDLQKQENPFNKRRRILMANKWSRRSTFYSWHNPKSMPLLALNEEYDEEKLQEEDDHDNPSSSSSSSSPRPDKLLLRPGKNMVPISKLKTTAFKSQSCFSLTDLEDQDDQ
ncbi:hypothetical protein K2173_000440 [Erythroxylum novogranatense]|uniref:Uncharacterized protein n=1 Tax=Erythroxylum novogranatense TaxID=1862640 RepID=A0AAV8SX78_9ROSI|nr:hypothetical protein K2173_000440 [Erythroxylum novogranatense]